MSELSNSQLVLLDNLIYYDLRTPPGCNVGEFVRNLINSGSFDVYKAENSEKYRILKLILKDPELCSLDIVNPYESTETKQFMSGFQDQEGNSTIVFRGTCDDIQWNDNAEVIVVSDTMCQQEALDYVEGMHAKYGFDDITVSGHSKGGNNSQYVTILSPYVERCLSLDGNGFSNDFIEKYRDEISKNKDKITSISDENDAVCQLGISIAGEVKYVKTNIGLPPDTHQPYVVIGDDGELIGPLQDEPGEFGKKIALLNKYIMALPEDVRSKVAHTAIETFIQGDAVSYEDVLILIFTTLYSLRALSLELVIELSLRFDLNIVKMVTFYLNELIGKKLWNGRSVKYEAKIKYSEQTYQDLLIQLRLISKKVNALDDSINLLTDSLSYLDTDKYWSAYIDLFKVSKNVRVQKSIAYAESTIRKMDQVEKINIKILNGNGGGGGGSW